MRNSAPRRSRTWAVPALIGVVTIALIAIVLAQPWADAEPGAGPEAPSAVAPADAPDLTQLEARDPEDPFTAGPVDAPVVLIVYADYQCPYCARWNEDTLPTMMDYAEAGKLRIEWRDVNVFGEVSERAARAAHAAALQDRYWAYHDALYPDGEILPASQLTDEALVALAGKLGLDRERFTADMNSDRVREATLRIAQEGQAAGVTGTPTFILAGRPLVGAQPRQLFIDYLESALKDAKN